MYKRGKEERRGEDRTEVVDHRTCIHIRVTRHRRTQSGQEISGRHEEVKQAITHKEQGFKIKPKILKLTK